MRRALVALGTCCALVLAGACSDDTDPKPKDASQDKLKFDTGVEDDPAYLSGGARWAVGCSIQARRISAKAPSTNSAATVAHASIPHLRSRQG